ncbi:unnamed protein product [Heligmosomoides polygyrus]|uniref:G protein-coupled receptor n=1 Tax=Heligmosomoides polygyrus TaxID=6339 RepID=A0A3P8AL68_HELPZ|nr:unnamed protein product [Heligmosomoides polygyrus]
MYLTIADTLYLSVATLFGSSGMCCNSALLYLIIWRSPSYLTPYRIFLANTAITQLLYSAAFMVVAPRLIAYDMRMVIIYLGPVQHFGPWWSYFMFVVMLHFAVNSFISIMLSMVFRWLCLKTLRFPTEAAVLMCVVGYLIPFSMVVSAPIIKIVSDPETNSRYLNYSVPDLSKYTTAVGTEVMQALTMQSLVPLISFFPASTMYVMAQFSVISCHMVSYFIIPCLSLSVFVDPIITIYYVVPFRQHIRRALGMRDYNTTLTLTTPGTTPVHDTLGANSTGVLKSRSSLF